MKESDLIETAEFTAAWRLTNEPAFIWWAPYILCKRDIIISAVKAHSKAPYYKYGVEILNSTKEVYALDEENGNTL